MNIYKSQIYTMTLSRCHCRSHAASPAALWKPACAASKKSCRAKTPRESQCDGHFFGISGGYHTIIMKHVYKYIYK